jgi:hypothetical protein
MIRAERHVLGGGASRKVVESSMKHERMVWVPKTLASIVFVFLLTFTCGTRAQQPGRSVAAVPSSPAWNDNSLITVQKNGGDSKRLGDVKIEFYGYDAFKITSPAGSTVLTNPWRNE